MRRVGFQILRIAVTLTQSQYMARDKLSTRK